VKPSHSSCYSYGEAGIRNVWIPVSHWIETEATGKRETALGSGASKFIELSSEALVSAAGFVKSEHTCIFERSYSVTDQHSIPTDVMSGVDDSRLSAVVQPVRVAVRSKAWTVFTRSNAGIVGSNLTQSTDVCLRLFCVCFALCR
jgi:hypothetical protein